MNKDYNEGKGLRRRERGLHYQKTEELSSAFLGRSKPAEFLSDLCLLISFQTTKPIPLGSVFHPSCSNLKEVRNHTA